MKIQSQSIYQQPSCVVSHPWYNYNKTDERLLERDRDAAVNNEQPNPYYSRRYLNPACIPDKEEF